MHSQCVTFSFSHTNYSLPKLSDSTFCFSTKPTTCAAESTKLNYCVNFFPLQSLSSSRFTSQFFSSSSSSFMSTSIKRNLSTSIFFSPFSHHIHVYPFSESRKLEESPFVTKISSQSIDLLDLVSSGDPIKAQKFLFSNKQQKEIGCMSEKTSKLIGYSGRPNVLGYFAFLAIIALLGIFIIRAVWAWLTKKGHALDPKRIEDRIAKFYDLRSEVWEKVWGEHMHHGYYADLRAEAAQGRLPNKKKSNYQAQVDMMKRLLDHGRKAELSAHKAWINIQQRMIGLSSSSFALDSSSSSASLFQPSPAFALIGAPDIDTNSTGRVIRVLDVGCGIGGASRFLAKEIPKRFISSLNDDIHRNPSDVKMEIQGVTLSSYQANRGNQLSNLMGFQDQVQVQVADALNLPFEDNSFDIVWSLESGEHMKDKLRFIQECTRVLKPGGKFLMAAWCIRECPPALTSSEKSLLQGIYREYCIPYMCTLSEFQTAAIRSGLRHVHLDDWSSAVKPFWWAVIKSAITNKEAIKGLFRLGLPLINSTLAIRHMIAGLNKKTIVMGALAAVKPSVEMAKWEEDNAIDC